MSRRLRVDIAQIQQRARVRGGQPNLKLNMCACCAAVFNAAKSAVSKVERAQHLVRSVEGDADGYGSSTQCHTRPGGGSSELLQLTES